MEFDLNRMKRADQVIAVCGAVLFICLFLPFFHLDLGPYGSHSFAGHSSGFLAWAGLWLGFLAGGLGFFPALGLAWLPQVPLTRTVAEFAASSLAGILLILKLLVGFHSLPRSVGLYIAVVAVVVQVVFAVLAFRESGEKLPTKADFQNLGGSSSGRSTSGGTVTPPQPPTGS